ncbi:hypothetical protein HDU96_005038 [Phlyctochytrium bullatum]|nr:hypothetical protein HDU96_005038 [Phlyctochytrium bullatum]
MLRDIFQFFVGLFFLSLPLFFMFVSIVVAIIWPVFFSSLQAAGVYPFRNVTNKGFHDLCYKLGEDLNIACEDVVIHNPSSTAFLACDSLDARSQYWPPLEFWNTSYAGTGRIYALDLKTNKLTKVELEDFEHGLTTHGLGIWWDVENPDDVIFNVVNHRPENSTIEIFEYKAQASGATSYKFKHLETVVDNEKGILNAPNNVQPTGRKTFYATNDHKSHKGIWRKVEEIAVSVVPNTHVVRRDETGNLTIAAPKVKYANGIAMNFYRDELYVVSLGDAAVFIYDIKANGNIQYRERIELTFPPDNISVDLTTGTIFATGHPKVFDFFKHIHNQTHPSPTWVTAIQNTTDDYDKYTGVNYWDRVVLADDGKFLSGGTVAATDSATNKTVLGAIFSNGIHVCDIDFAEVYI